MPVPTPFHPRTSARCHSMSWKDWAGCYAVCAYDTCHIREYFVIRQAAGLMDVSPLFKYDIKGPDAGEFLSWIMVRDIARLKVGRVAYTAWTNHRGKMLDDGTVTRLAEHHYRITAAEPHLHWFLRHSRGFNVHIEDTSRSLAALSLQGPTSREILRQINDTNLENLRFFHAQNAKLGQVDVVVTRTGYTGDLGYEIWVPNQDALALWDTLVEAGRNYGLELIGRDPLDVARIEAGFILAGVDYHSAATCLRDHQTSTPYEVDLEWLVHLDREPFIGQEALKAEKARGPQWATVGLEIDWEAIESTFETLQLPPHLPDKAWRTSKPLYKGANQVGYATSGAWSPQLKRNLALATVPTRMNSLGTSFEIEISVEHWRKRVPAVVVERPFFNPERKRL